MAVYRCVFTSFWSDRKVMMRFSPEDKFFFIYLLTNDKTHICGCYELNVEDASIDLGYNIETVKNLLQRMETYHNVIRTRVLDNGHIEVLILNWYRYNWNGSPKQIKAVENGANDIITPEFRRYVLETLRSRPRKEDIRPADKPSNHAARFASGAEGSSHGTRTESFSDGWPELEDIEAYVKEKGYGIYPKGLWFCMERNYWKDATGNPIRDWKSYIDTCEARGDFQIPAI